MVKPVPVPTRATRASRARLPAPATTARKAAPSTANLASEKPSKLTEQQGAPGEGESNPSGVHVPAARASLYRLRRLEHEVVARRPHHAASQRQPEAPPAEHQAGRCWSAELSRRRRRCRRPRKRPGCALASRAGAGPAESRCPRRPPERSRAVWSWLCPSWPCHQSGPPSSAQRLRLVLPTRNSIPRLTSIYNRVRGRREPRTSAQTSIMRAVQRHPRACPGPDGCSDLQKNVPCSEVHT